MNAKNSISDENSAITLLPDYKTEIIQILRSNFTPKLMRERILDYHENDIAAAMELMNKDERKRFYSILDTVTLADILEYSEQRNEYVGELSIRKRIDILSHFEISTAVEYLRQTEKEERHTLLDLMDDDFKSEISLLSSFDEDEIGSKMTTNYISVRAGIGIKQAMHELIEQAAENDNITTLYVVDEDEALVGAIDLKDLIIAREGTELDSITMTSYPYVYANEQIDDCIERIKEYSEDSIPVLDSNNKLKGVLTSQDITQLVDDELGDDYAKLAGLSSEEDLHEPLKKSISKRIPWLIVLLGLGLLVSSVVGAFEHVVAHLTLIVSFQSLILDMSGNVGTQSLAVTIRVLMDEKLNGKQKLYLVAKEA
ncbi:MAG: magnesium transporter, partial [Butyrivibrio sp.]|nr:magnesium transporter [Butyrivibrio sp.]